jgi:Abi-like protein
MNPAFFLQIEGILHTERIDAYRRDGADHTVTLARYLLNMALSESLYPALQFAEIALRNAVHRELTARCNTDAWYDSPLARLTLWQQDKVKEAKDALRKLRKPLTSGRIVAELTFGFWTCFFNNCHARTGIGSYLAKNAFTHAPASEQYQAKLDKRWQSIRDLRNRVFHHERILHWKDLDARQQAILEVICWISPELHDLAKTIDRFSAIRRTGLKPWLSKLQRHWPPTSVAAQAPISVSTLESVAEPFDASNGAETPFGHRWGGDVFTLTAEHITAMQDGQALVLDVMNEYVVFLKAEPEKETTKGEGAGDGE